MLRLNLIYHEQVIIVIIIMATIIIIIISHNRFPFLWYFSSWTTGAPHHSDFKFQIVALSLLCVMWLLQLEFCIESIGSFPGIVSGYYYYWAGIAQWCSAGWSGVRVPVWAGNFSHHRVQTGSEAHPVSYAFFLWAKRPGREADHSPPSSAEVNYAWNFTVTPPIRLHGMVLS
jgi:hypothetical protein